MPKRIARVAPNHWNTIVVPDPRPVPARTVEAGVFAFDSAFPRPGISMFLADLGHLVASGKRKITVFGHTDKAGSDAYNKNLADRRADAVLALLTRDLDALEPVCAAEAWGVPEHQAMMRTIGCDPGPPDGEVGAMTTAAVRAFQRGYNLRLWFESYQSPRYGQLEVTEELDDPTRAAIRDAYLNYVGLDRTARNFADVKAAGCGEFNPRAKADKDNRRVTLALFGRGQPGAPFPCTRGDVAACQIDDDGERRCKFYREQVDEPPESPELPAFFNDHWMPTPSKWAYMSALTSLPDGEAVKFTVYRTRSVVPSFGLDSIDSDLPPDLEEIATANGAVVCGVAFAVWKPDAAFSPWLPRTWYDKEGIEPSDAELLFGPVPAERLVALHEQARSHAWYRPPVFRIEGGGQWFLSRPPGRRVRGIASDVPASWANMVLMPDGRFVGPKGDGEALQAESNAVGVDFGLAVRDEEGESA